MYKSTFHQYFPDYTLSVLMFGSPDVDSQLNENILDSVLNLYGKLADFIDVYFNSSFYMVTTINYTLSLYKLCKL